MTDEHDVHDANADEGDRATDRTGDAGATGRTGPASSRRDFLRTATAGALAGSLGTGLSGVAAGLSPLPPPENVRVTESGPYSLTVAWDRPQGIDDGTYAVGLSADGLTWTSRTTEETSLTVEGPPVTPSTTYEVRAVIPSSAVQSASPPVTATTPGPADGAPEAPASFRASNRSEESLELAWDLERDRSAIDHYELAFARVDGDVITGEISTRVPEPRADASWPTTYLSDLTETTTYRAWVWAVGADGTRSGAAALTTATVGDALAPWPPTGLRTLDRTEESLTIGWEGASDEGDAGLSHYDVRWDLLDGGYAVPGPLGSTTVEAGTTQTTIDGLGSGRSYRVAIETVDEAENRSVESTLVAATAGAGDGVVSASLSVTGDRTSDPAHGAEVTADADATVFEVDGTVATPSPCYTVTLDDARVDDDVLYLTVRTVDRGTEQPCPGVVSATEYEAQVRVAESVSEVVVSHRGPGEDWQTTWTPEPNPVPAPANVSAETEPLADLTVSWDPVAGDADVVGYEVFVDGERSHLVGPDADESPVGALSPGTTYEVGVATLTTAGERSSTATVSAETPAVDVGGIDAAGFAVSGPPEDDGPANRAEVAVEDESAAKVIVTGALPATTPLNDLRLVDLSYAGEELGLTVGTVTEMVGSVETEVATGPVAYAVAVDLAAPVSRVVVEHEGDAGEGWRTTESVTMDALPAVGENENRPTDPDDDGLYEDLTGNGETDPADVVTLFEHKNDPAVADNPDAYDFSGNGDVEVADVVRLFEELSG